MSIASLPRQRTRRAVPGLVALATLGLALLPALAPAPALAQQAGWQVAKHIPIGGEGFWDYLAVDTANNRLYVSHGTHVVVVDLARDTVTGDLPNTDGVHGIAFAPEFNRGFTSNGRDSTTTIFDLKTLKEIGRVNVQAANPDAIVYDPFTKRIFTMNGRSADASAIDAATGKVAGVVALGGRPEAAASDGAGRLYINIEDRSEVAEVDPQKLTVLRRWSIAPCEGPSGLAIDVAHARLFSVCDGVMAISDAKAGKLLTTVPIGQGPDGAAFDPGLGLAFSSNGQDGTLSVVQEKSPDSFAVLQTVPTQRSARTIALDPRTHRVYLSAAEYGPMPEAQPGQRRRPPVVAGSFQVLVVQRAP
jgi:DNA-binding beta-propeller fold protein YncE